MSEAQKTALLEHVRARFVTEDYVTDIVVVDTPDALLVTTTANAQRVKAVVDALKLSGRSDVL